MDRLLKLRAFLKEQNLDSIFITSPDNLFYFTGFLGLSPTEREAYAFITSENAYIITSKIYAQEVKKTVTSSTLIQTSPEYNYLTAITDVIKKENIQSVGFEESNLTFAEHKRISQKIKNFIPTSLHDLRVIKDSQEITAIGQACKFSDMAFKKILKDIKPGVTEKEIARTLENYMRDEFAFPSFPSIIAFGKNAAVPHHMSGNDTLENNQFVLLDFGVKVANYCSDMTRTVFLGIPTAEQKHMYEAVRIAQEKAIEYISSQFIVHSSRQDVSRPTMNHEPTNYKLSRKSQNNVVKASEIDKIAREYIVSQGYPSFPHSLGHGIGIEVHESPSLSPYSQDILQEGMVFSVEPGVYLDEKAGIRIEDLVVLEKNEPRLLTQSSRKLIII